MRLHSRAETAEFLETRAAQMRAEPEPAERALFDLLDPMGNWEFQVPIWGETKNGGEYAYIADAFYRKLKLIVEVDGGSHRKKTGRDRRRDTLLATAGVTTLRLSNREVLRAPESAKAKVVSAMGRLGG